ncbi:uncharacterized protein F5891DRAFT_1048242 [Suillus fuscotomentosus]|uniref:Uncharacterized protein n=1 Tax=Suillus fuscotomentosus TaxID=1912939 RepID=A0AAD4HI97_9AGAM|nr:uncharacterized protein F5891DRAFT_1048242 [Suillus fuscotomentosus]KAG1897598.1 hypothetical protein F5891DRAFT_1048242 [Suillus fuscotomentosus]
MLSITSCCVVSFSRLYPFFVSCCHLSCCPFYHTTMATSASFHGVVDLWIGSRYQIGKKNYWRYDAFVTTSELDMFETTSCSHLVRTPRLRKTESIYWMHGPLLVLSLTMKERYRE